MRHNANSERVFSTHRAVIVDYGRAISGGTVSQVAVHAALEEYGRVWHMEQMGSKWLVTFQAATATSALIASGALVVEGAPEPFPAEHYQVVGKKSCVEEERLLHLMENMKRATKSGSMKIEDVREPQPIAAGTSFDWSIRLTNRGTQPRTLLSVEVSAPRPRAQLALPTRHPPAWPPAPRLTPASPSAPPRPHPGRRCLVKVPYQPADAAVCFSLKGPPQSKGKQGLLLSQTFSHTQAAASPRVARPAPHRPA